MKCSRQKERPSSEPAADSSQSATLHRRVSAIAGHPRRKKLTNILARLSNEVEVPWEEGRAEEPGHFYAHGRSEEHTSELQSRPHLVCRLLLEEKKHIHSRSLSVHS